MVTKTKREPDVRETATAIRRSITRLARRLRLERAGHGISSSRLSALGQVLRAGPLTATALATLEHIQPQSLTRILADLKKKGLIRSERAATDRRQVRIEITQKGREQLAQDARQLDAWLARVMVANLTESEQEMLSIAARLLTRLSDEPSSRGSAGPDRG